MLKRLLRLGLAYPPHLLSYSSTALRCGKGCFYQVMHGLEQTIFVSISQRMRVSQVAEFYMEIFPTRGALLLCPCLFCPSDNVWRSRCADAPRCAILFYCYHTFLDHRTNISRKLHARRRVSVSGALSKFQNCHLDKTNMDKTSQHLIFWYTAKETI